MTEIRTTKMVEKTEVKFVANDGTEFKGDNAKLECEQYERRVSEDKVKKAFARLDSAYIDIPFATWWYGDDAKLLKVELTSKQDYYTLIDYLVVVDRCYEYKIYLEEPKEYPYTMLVGEGYETASEYTNDLKEQLQKTLEQLG